MKQVVFILRRQWRRGAVVVLGLVSAAFLLRFVNPVYAQGLVGQVIELLREKAGFGYSDGDGFVFAKHTPNYRAFAGVTDPIGGHRIRLERDGAFVELSYVSSAFGYRNAQNERGGAVKLTTAQQRLLTAAEDLLYRQSTFSAQGRIPVPPEQRMTDEERAVVMAADELLARLANVAEATQSGGLLSQEALDFALLLRLKAFLIRQLSLDVDVKLAEVAHEVSSIVSQATLIEEPGERKVSFVNIAPEVTMDYRLNEAGIRQQIILNSVKKAYSVFTFKLNISGLSYTEKGKGVWYFADAKNRSIMRVPKGWAKDSLGTFTNDVDIVLAKEKDVGDVYRVLVPEQWLNAPERVFPVIVETGIEIVPEMRQGAATITPTDSVAPTVTAAPVASTSSPVQSDATGSGEMP